MRNRFCSIRWRPCQSHWGCRRRIARKDICDVTERFWRFGFSRFDSAWILAFCFVCYVLICSAPGQSKGIPCETKFVKNMLFSSIRLPTFHCEWHLRYNILIQVPRAHSAIPQYQGIFRLKKAGIPCFTHPVLLHVSRAKCTTIRNWDCPWDGANICISWRTWFSDS